MKKILSIIAVVALLSFAADKFITVKFTEPQINYHWQNLENVKKVIDASSLPHNQVVYVIQSIDSLQKDIQKSAKLDTTKTK